jgi:hypothetical protein
VLAAVAAVPATARSPSRTRTFTTGSFVVNCTSTGQVCSPPENLTISLPRRGTLTSVTYSTAATHCSAVLVRVLLAGHVVAKTQRLEAGERSETLSTHVALHGPKTTLGFKAQGFTGGCNTGRVGSWGGKVTVKVLLSRRG